MMILTPAYGRDYKSKAAVLADFNVGKDFVQQSLHHGSGRYVNKEEIEVGEQVEFRYGRLMKVFIYEVK